MASRDAKLRLNSFSRNMLLLIFFVTSTASGNEDVCDASASPGSSNACRDESRSQPEKYTPGSFYPYAVGEEDPRVEAILKGESDDSPFDDSHYSQEVQEFKMGRRSFNDSRRIRKANQPGERHAISGVGSTIEWAQEFVDFLPGWLSENKITSMVECPSGHWPSGWQREVKWPPLKYTMLDLNKDVAKHNQEYIDSGSAPQNLRATAGSHDFLKQPLPEADVLLTRHVLHHIPNRFIHRWLDFQVRVCPRRFKYVMINEPSNDLPDLYPPNQETANLTGWRTLNMSQPPFSLPTKIVLKSYWPARAQVPFPDRHCKNRCFFDSTEVYEVPEC